MNSQFDRVDWVDCAKGICIAFVVMMHSTLGVEEAVGQTGYMHALVAFAKPFRMPDFFLISGLFLSRVINRDWPTYIDRKVIHFAYFYTLWVTIQFAVKAPLLAEAHGWPSLAALYLEAYIEPFGTLWFIYLLPIFFVVTKATRTVHPAIIWFIAAALEIARIDTGWTVIDEFASRFVYFYTGYLFAPPVFRLAADVQAKPMLALAVLVLWARINFEFVAHGLAELPFVSLALGFIGAGAVISVAALMAKSRLFAPVRYLGQHSIVIYLSFFLPMVVARVALLRSGAVTDIGDISVIVTLAGILGSLSIWWAVRSTPLYVLFERPARYRIAERPRAMLQPAE